MNISMVRCKPQYPIFMYGKYYFNSTYQHLYCQFRKAYLSIKCTVFSLNNILFFLITYHDNYKYIQEDLVGSYQLI